MDQQGPDRTTLRRAAFAYNRDLLGLADELDALDPGAAKAVRTARLSLFEAWTILCVPPEEDEDDHDH